MHSVHLKWKIIAFLLVALPVSSSFVFYYIIYPSNSHASQVFSDSFAFAWSPMQQEIANGTFWINVTWTWKAENLSMTVNVNDKSFYYLDYLGFAFDGNHNGIIESPVQADGGATGWFPYNQYWSGKLGLDGSIAFASSGLLPSKSCTCTFSNETGYEFKISLPGESQKISHPLLIHLCYYDCYSGIIFPPEYDFNKHFVFIEFEV